MFGHPTRGDERTLLRFDPNGDVRVARRVGSTGIDWRIWSNWRLRRSQLTFEDNDSAREFRADLAVGGLGGTWRDVLRSGGWWCLAIDDTRPFVSESRVWMPPLLPDVMATPWYPRRAIREAKEGTVVACFTVGSDGRIRDPVLIELSDEIFRNPALSALQRSRYVPWKQEIPARPGCRSFSFELESVR